MKNEPMTPEEFKEEIYKTFPSYLGYDRIPNLYSALYEEKQNIESELNAMNVNCKTGNDEIKKLKARYTAMREALEAFVNSHMKLNAGMIDHSYYHVQREFRKEAALELDRLIGIAKAALAPEGEEK